MKISMIGCTGRMGKAIIEQIADYPEYSLVGGATHKGSDSIGEDLGDGVFATSDLAAAIKPADVVIDFSRPDMTMELLDALQKNPKPVIIGTTGFNDIEQATIEKLAKKMPILLSSNTSLGVNLLFGLVRQAARKLGAEYDIEIVEMHHKHKVDAPSGTAISLGKAAAEGRGITLDSSSVTHNRPGKREQGNIGFASLRGGDVVGEHNVIFAGAGERLELGHIATNRTIFATGALTAAKWLIGKKPALYSMQDVLFS
jgi:4-hydroxy-tetrahydrodipicolinate reductase